MMNGPTNFNSQLQAGWSKRCCADGGDIPKVIRTAVGISGGLFWRFQAPPSPSSCCIPRMVGWWLSMVSWEWFGSWNIGFTRMSCLLDCHLAVMWWFFRLPFLTMRWYGADHPKWLVAIIGICGWQVILEWWSDLFFLATHSCWTADFSYFSIFSQPW